MNKAGGMHEWRRQKGNVICMLQGDILPSSATKYGILSDVGGIP